MKTYPETDLVILAGGQARRMKGLNKLLQKFDDDIQLLKIYTSLKEQVSQIWVNSHRDTDLYQQLIPDIQCYEDGTTHSLGPLMGMKSAWTYTKADYVLFIPCDITYIPDQIVSRLHAQMSKDKHRQITWVSINRRSLYPFCLMKRECQSVIKSQLEHKQLSLKSFLEHLRSEALNFDRENLLFHSINSVDELQQYQRHSLIKNEKLLDSL